MYSSAGRRIAYQKGFGDGRGAAELDAIRRLAGGNSLFLGTGKGFVRGTDADDPAGVRMGRWAWGAIFTDLDGDGREDIVSPSGFLTGPKPGDL